MEPESFSPYPQEPATCSYPEPTPSSPHTYFVYGCLILPLETLPPGDPIGGVVYLRIVLFPEEASQLVGNS
jgi:hypothetical protein